LRPKNKDYLCFEEAKKYVHELKIKDYNSWIIYTKSVDKPIFLPTDPHGVYKKQGWISWGDFLGNGHVHGRVRKYTVNDDFFKTWSHDMAYILGFWWADGFITKKEFSITQHKSDKYILEKILQKMNSNYPILFHYRNNVRFFIKSKTIVNDIIKLGGMERKSLAVGFPKKIPKEYFFDFVRGILDGDGTVFINPKVEYKCLLYSGSELFLLELQKEIKKIIPEINSHFYRHVSKMGSRVVNGFLKRDSTSYRLTFFKNDSKILYKYLYTNSNELCLSRKKDKFQSFFI
jgi:hypothetical protein